MRQRERRTVKIRLSPRLVLLLALLVLTAFAAAGCGRDDEDAAAGGGDTAAETNAGDEDLSGRIEADGSSTVGPFTTFAAEQFQGEQPDVQVTVGISGTGGGFERFCVGETDISNASRPINEDDEVPICEENGIEFVEFHVVNDGLAVVVNPENDWVECFTTEQLNAIWAPEAEGEVTSWSQVDPSWPDQELVLAGPGTDSGTFDYFTETINDEGGASRSDFAASENDNDIVNTVAGNPGGHGYFGLSYVEENEGSIKAVPVENEDGECVEPSVETVQDGSYNPLGRPLFIYVKQDSFERPEVQAFVQYMLNNNAELAEAALYVPLTEEQLTAAQESLDEALTGP
jgi:phosphate transport system substrate-binding protein